MTELKYEVDIDIQIDRDIRDLLADYLHQNQWSPESIDELIDVLGEPMMVELVKRYIYRLAKKGELQLWLWGPETNNVDDALSWIPKETDFNTAGDLSARITFEPFGREMEGTQMKLYFSS